MDAEERKQMDDFWIAYDRDTYRLARASDDAAFHRRVDLLSVFEGSRSNPFAEAWLCERFAAGATTPEAVLADFRRTFPRLTASLPKGLTNGG